MEPDTGDLLLCGVMEIAHISNIPQVRGYFTASTGTIILCQHLEIILEDVDEFVRL